MVPLLRLPLLIESLVAIPSTKHAENILYVKRSLLTYKFIYLFNIQSVDD